MDLYDNTPEIAETIGWKYLPEHCHGDKNSSHVIHDVSKGEFYYAQVNCALGVKASSTTSRSTVRRESSEMIKTYTRGGVNDVPTSNTDGICNSCGRDNRGHEDEPCSDDCQAYWEERGFVPEDI